LEQFALKCEQHQNPVYAKQYDTFIKATKAYMDLTKSLEIHQ
jgi:hypothetical protein